MRNVKKVLAIFLAVLFVLPGLGVGLTASAEDTVMFTVVPNVTTAHPGGTITYSVYMDPVTGLDGLQLKLGLPDGLTFGQADTNTNLLEAMRAECPEFGISFYESSLTLFIFTISTSEHFTSTENDVLLTFTCTVDDDAAGEKTIDLPTHVITSRAVGGSIPTEYDSTDSVVTVKPAAPIKTINLVSGKADYITGAQTSNVWFGNYKQSGNKTDGWSVDPIKWRVLSNADGKLFLLSDQNLDACVYYERYFTATWETSTIRAWLNGTGEFSEENFKDSAFSSGEDAAVCVTNVSNPDSVFDDRTVPGGSDTADKVFLLSRDEAMNTAYGFTDSVEPTDTRVSINTAYTGSGGSNYGWTSAGGSADYWWLRSPGSADDRAAIVFETGQLNPGGYDVPNRSIAVRPAVNVDLGKVLFTSAAENGKQGDGLTAVGTYTGADWKLTLLDDSRSFAVTANASSVGSGSVTNGYNTGSVTNGTDAQPQTAVKAQPGNNVTLTYSGAAVGENEYISAILTDESGDALYYGRLAQPTAANGTVTVTIPADLASGEYTLKLFSEQYNGDKMTDYASALVDVTLTVSGLFTGKGTKDAPYEIASDEDWQTLSQFVADGGETEGLFFRQTADVNASTYVGTEANPFAGTYDGGGKTLTAALDAPSAFIAPFSYISGATIENLRVDGTVSGDLHSAGLVGAIKGTGNLIRNCVVAVAITAKGDYCGGFVGHGSSSETTIEGCVFTGSIIAGSNCNAGVFWGRSENGAKVTIRNCLENGTAYSSFNFNPVGMGYAAEKVIDNVGYRTAQNGSPNRNWDNAGTKLYAIERGENVSLVFGEAATFYDVSGLGVYDSGLMLCGADAFAPANSTVTLTASYTGDVPDGFAAEFSASAGTLADGALTMPAQDVTISATLVRSPKAINLVSGEADYIKGGQTSNVWFGNYMQSSADSKEPVKWRVLENKDGKLFLLSDQNLDVARLNETWKNVNWETCTMRSWMNGYDATANTNQIDYTDDNFKENAFSSQEYAAVAETVLRNSNEKDGGNDTTDKVFVLSCSEAENADYGFTDNYAPTDTRIATNTAYVAAGGTINGQSMNKAGEADAWWLRTPIAYYHPGLINKEGKICITSVDINDNTIAVRPALNIDLGKVLFTSAAENGKPGDGLTAVETYTGSDWKLTVLDDSRSGFKTRCTAIENGVYTITYSGAQTGENEKISAMIVDADGVVTYYGVLENAKAGENTLTLDVSGKLSDGDKLYVFNEQVNGDKKTDYASDLQDVTELFHYKTGDTLQYGTYPQSEVTDAATVAALNAKLRSNGWISYGYYIGTGDYNGEMAPGDFMRYQDVVLDGVKYRAVTFDSYRPGSTTATSSADNSNQDENGYEPGKTYWFQFEPITWKVLDPESGLVLCTGAIDAQAYHNYINEEFSFDLFQFVSWGNTDKTKRANDYAHSSIRAWLNEDFINTAFSEAQQENMKASELNNSFLFSTPDTYDYASTSDKFFLPSYQDVTAYIFDPNASALDEARQMTPSDYAKCQGIWEDTTKTSTWWLRTPKNGDDVCSVYSSGSAVAFGRTNFASTGVVPAMRMQELQDDPTGAPLKVTPEVELTYNVQTVAMNSAITDIEIIVRNATITSVTGLPNGLSWSGTTIWGAPTETGTFTITVTVTSDQTPSCGTASALAVITVNPLPEVTVSNAVQTITIGDAIDDIEIFAVHATITSVTGLPAGVSWSGTTISGTPTETGSFDVTVTVTSNQTPGCGTASADVTITVLENKYTVKINPADNMTKAVSSGSTLQSVEAGSAMTDVVYTANDGYYFPADYAVDSVNGVSVTRDSWTQITISGTPTGDVTLTLPSPTVKPTPTVTAVIKDGKESFEYGETVIAIMTIPADATHDPKVGGDLTIYLNDKSVAAVDAENGTARYEFPTLDCGEYTLRAVYNGDDHYAPAESETTTFTVTQSEIFVDVIYDESMYVGETQEIRIELSSPLATGDVTVSLKGYNYPVTTSYTVTMENGVGTFTTPLLDARSYLMTVSYPGDENHAACEVEFPLTVTKRTPELTMTAKPTNDAGTQYEITITKPEDSVGSVTFGVESMSIVFQNDRFENGAYTFLFPDVIKKYMPDDMSGEYELTARYDGEYDDLYESNRCVITVTLACEHVWKEPTWDWTQDVHNPTYSAECNNCTDVATGTVESVEGERVEATVDEDAYTPYTAEVTLGEQTFTDTFKAYEPGTAFEAYKQAQKKAAGDKAQTGDSDDCKQLIEDAKDRIDDVQFNENNTLQQNKDAVDEAANLAGLEKALTDQRAADAVEDKIDAIGEVEYTDECKQKIDDAREAYDDLTDEQKALVDNVDDLTDAEAEYERLDNHAQFEQYKEDMKKAAGDKALPGDSAECAQLIEDAKDRINDVEYDESKSLADNKQAVDAAANLAQLDADLAEHRAIHYADFYADGKPVESVPYTIDTKSIDEPAVPEKTGYTGTWPSYTLEAGGVRIDAVYETIPYEATFYADGVLVDTVTYNVETTSIADKEPAVPEKPGHTGAWPDYTLKVGGTRIDAVYEVIMQTVDFDPNGGEGEIESVTTAWGSKVTLPECTFTAPNGKEFDKWDAGNPGDEVEVKSDLTVKAVWKEKPLTLTADVDPTQTGERIKITVPYARRGGIAATLTASEEGVRYESSKPGVISVDENGVIRLEKLCLFCKTATITAYSADGQKVASCVVNVRHAWWQYIIWFFFGSFWF